MSTTETNDDNQTQALDRMVHVAIGQVTQGVSPSSVMLAYLDWLVHLQSSPAKWVQLSIKVRRKLYVDPDEWFARTSVKEGSWWPEWESWLSARSSPEQVDPPTMRADRETFAALCDAPGTYVLQK